MNLRVCLSSKQFLIEYRIQQSEPKKPKILPVVILQTQIDMFIRSKILLFILILLAICVNCVRIGHLQERVGTNPSCGHYSKPYVYYDSSNRRHYMESKIPQQNSKEWLHFQKVEDWATEGYNACYSLEDSKLYIGNKSAWVLPYSIVYPDDWEYALVGNSKFIENNSEKYFGTLETEDCQQQFKMRIKCTQNYKGKTFVSYLVNSRIQSFKTWAESIKNNLGYWDAIFVGQDLLKTKYTDADSCFFIR